MTSVTDGHDTMSNLLGKQIIPGGHLDGILSLHYHDDTVESDFFY